MLGQNSHYRAERRKEGLRQTVEIISFSTKSGSALHIAEKQGVGVGRVRGRGRWQGTGGSIFLPLK